MKVTSPSGSGSDSTAGKGCSTIFLGIFAIAGLAFTVFLGKTGIETVRSHFWDRTDCVIESSAATEDGDRSEFTVRYTYRADGRTRTGTRFRVGMTPTLTAAGAQRAAQRYSAGTAASCYVNPSSPDESTLERGALWPMLFMLIPLLFVAIRVGGIIAVWRAKSFSRSAVSERHRARGGGKVFLRLFGLLFICVGGGLLYAMLVRPMLREFSATKWPQVPCEIQSSRLGVHSGSKSSTYSVEVRYRYEFKGRPYTGTQYNFDTGSSSSRGWRSEVVGKFTPGLKTLCHVNPEDPLDAVLSVKPSPDRWFGLIPGVFLVVGLVIFLKAPAMANRGVSKTGLPADSLPRLPSDPATGEVMLQPAMSRMGCFIIAVIVALVWNGVVWAFFMNMTNAPTGARVMLGIFAFVGAAIAAGTVYQFLALFNPLPVLTASSGSIPLGGTLGVRCRFTGNVRRIVRLTITLEAREEATYRRGTTTSTDRNVFAILPLTDTADQSQIACSSAKITIPRNLIHTLTASNNKIVWTLKLNGDIPKWPDVTAEFPITVLPCDPATIFHAQNPTP